MEILWNPIFMAAGGYVTSALCLLLAVLVFYANPQSKSCRLTALFNGSISFWAFFFASHFLAGNKTLGLLCTQFLSLGTVLLSVFLTHFVLVETKQESRHKRFLAANYFVSALIAIGIFVPGIILLYPTSKMGLPSYTDPGPLYSLIPLQLFFNLFFSSFRIIQALKRTKGFRKNQLQLFFFAILVGYATGTPAYLLVYDIPISPVSASLVSIVPIILSYTIIKHRFLDIEKLAKNTLIFSLLFIALVAFVSVVLIILKEVISRWVGISEAMAQAIAIALAIGLYGPLKTGLSRFTNRLLFQHSQNPETIFTNLSEGIVRFLDAKKLAEEVTGRIAQNLSLDRMGFYSRSHTQSYLFELQACVGRIRKKHIHQSKQLIQYFERARDYLVTSHPQGEARRLLRKNPFFALQNIKEVKRQAAMELAALEGIAAFPVFVRDTLRAVLVTGRKKSDAPWNEEELQILKSFTRHLSLALGNADYAEEIRRFREKLSLNERDASAGALIAAVDHEVKSTIHGMSLNLTTLAADLSNPKSLSLPRENVEKIILETMESVRRGGKKINGIIQHLSDLAERKPLSIEEGVRPFEIADRVIQELRDSGQDERIRIQSKIPKTLRLACDPAGLYEILANLIQNAQQAILGEGAILIEGAAENGEVTLRIRDTGVGIPEECVEHIFEPFYTTKTANAGSGQPGTGMGLFIVKEYMQGMGGRVEVESIPARGTVFSLRFPNFEPAFGKGTP